MTFHCHTEPNRPWTVASPTTRVSDAERDGVVDALIRHHVDGRLTGPELEERSAQALGARTAGELRQALVDLPPLPTHRRDARLRRAFPFPAVPVAIGLAVVAGSHDRALLPLVLLALVMWFVVF